MEKDDPSWRIIDGNVESLGRSRFTVGSSQIVGIVGLGDCVVEFALGSKNVMHKHHDIFFNTEQSATHNYVQTPSPQEPINFSEPSC